MAHITIWKWPQAVLFHPEITNNVLTCFHTADLRPLTSGSLTSAVSVLQPCCKREEKAVWKNLLLQSILVSQAISVPFRRPE